ncbi:DUF1564 family protein [Leptospira idonii]|uniref:DUF1564 family protein n=1 Tax=Leptospira idonii TaxID=1193500 RepID=A0A4R9LTX3_9LEPT|nr:DUF1564 family protein [Leptospira idonii]TGN17195.1 DUF1564 family protein [Leptospira idonii]
MKDDEPSVSIITNWNREIKTISITKPEANSLYFYEKGSTIVTTFLLPPKLLQQLQNPRNVETSSFSARLRNLLEESAYPIYYGLIPSKRKKLTKSYQDPGQELQKISCRADERELAEMDILADALGISRSKLLSLLLAWEEIGWLGIMRTFGIVRDTTTLQMLASHRYLTKAKDFQDPQYKVELCQILARSSPMGYS